MKRKSKLTLTVVALVLLAISALFLFVRTNKTRDFLNHTTDTADAPEPSGEEYYDLTAEQGIIGMDDKKGEHSETWRVVNPTIEAFYDSEAYHAQSYGALAKMTLRVTDSTGKPVSYAKVTVGLAMRQEVGTSVVTGKTDDGGLFSFEGMASSHIRWTISKNGHYTTTEEHSLRKGISAESVKNGKWQPWNPTVEVTLKEKRNPVEMIQGFIEKKVPVKDESFGFDVFKQDWVAPHGKGEVADFIFTYNEPSRTNIVWGFNLGLEFSNAVDGAYVALKDEYSELYSEQEVDGSRLAPKFFWIIERTNDKILQDKRLRPHEWMAFRVRSKTNESGGMYGGFYGKIQSLEFVGAGKETMRFSFYLNPVEGNRSIEAE
jgi:hypothetical protein